MVNILELMFINMLSLVKWMYFTSVRVKRSKTIQFDLIQEQIHIHLYTFSKHL